MSAPRFVLGIDPGLQGALAFYDTRTGSLFSVQDMPVENGKVDPAGVAQLMGGIDTAWPGAFAALENVHSRPRQAGAFGFGVGVGVLQGALASHGIPFALVSPSVWKAAMGLTRGQNETESELKDRSRALASQLFPASADLFKRKKDDGRAEASLIAYYAATHGVLK